MITARVRPGAAPGDVPLVMSQLEALDGSFTGIPTQKTDGKVVVAGAEVETATSTEQPTSTSTPAADTPTSTFTPGGAATETPTVTPTAAPATATPTATETPGFGEPGTLGVSPQMQSVEDGAAFNVSVVQNVSVPVFGLVTDFTFNPALVQVSDIAHGTAYLAADLSVGDPGETKAQAIVEANTTGRVRAILLYLSEGGSVAPGEAEALKISMTAKQDISGISPLGVSNVAFYGNQAVSVTRIDGLVEVFGPATVTPTFTATPTHTLTPTATTTAPAVATNTPTRTNTPVPPTATHTHTPTRTHTPQPTLTPTSFPSATPQTTQTVSAATNTPTNTPAAGGTPSPTGGTPTVAATSGTPTAASGTTSTPLAQGTSAATPTVDPATAQGKINITPPTVTAPPGAEFTVILVQDAPFVTTGAETDFKFDPAIIEIVAVEKSAAYQKGQLLAGVVPVDGAPQTMAQAIAEANTTGTLKNLAAFFVPGSGSIPAGPSEFLRIKLKAKANSSNTTTSLTLADLEMLNADGEPITVAPGTSGQVTVQAGAAAPTPVGSTSTVAGASTLPNAGKAPYGELNWALTISLIAMLASGAALVGSLAQKEA